MGSMTTSFNHSRAIWFAASCGDSLNKRGPSARLNALQQRLLLRLCPIKARRELVEELPKPAIMPPSSTLTVFSGLIQPYSFSLISKYQLTAFGVKPSNLAASWRFPSLRLVIPLLTEEGFDAASKLAMRESVAQGLLPQKPTNETVLLARRNTSVGVGRLFPARLTRKSALRLLPLIADDAALNRHG
ncbi:hypothetical protein HZ326_27332 [Fusarium oxysporum f. sp. albedinis]|nr:hypothetical protein HZ326_27332 [Fusarium oxysporum f. sp. albedinis]